MTDPPTGRFDAPAGPIATPWQGATVLAATAETPTARTLRLRLERPVEHVPGQHYVVRLTADDGYQASRAYSVASAPDPSGEIELTIELLPDGEVSSHLHHVLEPGDQLEVRGPLGRWFTWDGTRPALLVAGGSGLVPLASMLRTARRLGRSELVRLVVSVRSPQHLYYADELPGPEVTVVHTRSAPPGHPRPPGRLVETDLGPVPEGTTVYLCGGSGFVEHVSGLLLDRGIDPGSVRVERFGPS